MHLYSRVCSFCSWLFNCEHLVHSRRHVHLCQALPRSERGTVWPAHCPAAPATPPDRTPPCTSHSDCCQSPPGTSAGMKRGGGQMGGKKCLTQSSVLWGYFFNPRTSFDLILIHLTVLTSCTRVVVLIMRTLFWEPHHSFPPTGTILVTGLVGEPRTNVWEDWASQKLPAEWGGNIEIDLLNSLHRC